MVTHFREYKVDIKKLFIAVFGQDIFDAFNKIELKVLNPGVLDVDPCPASPNINERFDEYGIEYARDKDLTPFDIFIGVVYEYGLQQCKDHDLFESKKHTYFFDSMIDGVSEKEFEAKMTEMDKFEKNRRDFSDYMDSSKDLMKKVFGYKLYNRIKNIKLVAFEWNGLDVTTSSIRATSPGIKERFTEDWVKYANKRDRGAMEIFLQSVFHYGYQYGMDQFVEPERKRAQMLSNSLKKLNQKQQ